MSTRFSRILDLPKDIRMINYGEYYYKPNHYHIVVKGFIYFFTLFKVVSNKKYILVKKIMHKTD